ncbi:class I adenylate-forming enzyme family protein [Natranaerofaba carboxydovora]|uniref:class I adenylate-forming enzyme family protein n=1 Tax=Natranaerofaba carboxydovora TaxID=2742683 RepID=UPI001F145947|nr:long-chain-fatty-acid--CoA ligase [Natranaerofaba carboxydovora]UMZ74306.1 Long-chain-fatty-acid--CoA ligase [Natranaerofaba carboxydovora]
MKNKLAYMINRTSRYFPDDTALVYGDKRFTFKEVNDRSNRCAKALARLGVKKGDRVAILLPNCNEFVEVDFALIKSGFVRVPLNPRLSSNECSYIINDSEANTLVFSSELYDKVKDIIKDLETVKNFIFVGDDPDEYKEFFQDYEEMLKLENSEEVYEEVSNEDLYQILYTSGTTGKPKGAVTDFQSRYSSLITCLVDEMKINRNDVLLTVAPIAHGGGTKILPHFVQGACNVIMPRFSTKDFCKIVEKEKVTTIWMVPTMINMLINFKELDNYDLSSIKTIVYAAAPMPVSLLKQAMNKFGRVFVQVYGLSEAPNPVLVLPKEDHVLEGTDEQLKRLQSAGREAFGVRVRVVDDNDKDVEVGEIGEIITTGENVMREYWKKPEESAKELKDGWFYTGDMAKIDENGYVYIVDRRKDMIISGGFNIYPREIEEVLYEHPEIQDAVVFGLPDELWGEKVKAVVVLKEDSKSNEEDILDYCDGKIANYKIPKSIDIVDNLPKGPTGKILKKETKKWYTN